MSTDLPISMITPVHVLALAVVVVLLLVPSLIPVAGRLLGRMVGNELRRRMGLPARPVLRSLPDRRRKGAVPAEPGPGEPESEPRARSAVPPKPRRGASVAGVVLVVSAVAAVLLWYLLHSR